MARGKKTDKETKKKVIRMKIEDPSISNRQIEKKLGVCRNTVDKIINEVPDLVQRSDKDIIADIDSIIEDITDITKKFLKLVDPSEIKSKDVKALTDVMKTNFDRKQILTGKPTDIKDINFNLEGMSVQEIEEIKNALLN